MELRKQKRQEHANKTKNTLGIYTEMLAYLREKVMIFLYQKFILFPLLKSLTFYL